MMAGKKLDSQYRELQQNFALFLKAQGETTSTIETAKSDAFYLVRHNDTIDFMELLRSPDFEKLAYEHLQKTLLAKSTAKGQNISSYMSSIRRLHNYVQGNTISSPPVATSSPPVTIKDKTSIPRPSCDEVEKYLQKWRTTADLYEPEAVLKELFTKTRPYNQSIDDIILKAAALNTVYNTRITSIYPVAQRILSLDIDERLRSGDEKLVNELMGVDYMINGKASHTDHYSFASKYCSFHNSDAFPIYDSYVDAILWHYRNLEHFSIFNRNELKDYPKFKRIIKAFQQHFGLKKYTVKQLDQYLWQFGKEYF